MRPVCIPCRREMKPSHTGAVLQENVDEGGRPYKIWSVDIFKCPGCGTEVASGFANNPLWTTYAKDEHTDHNVDHEYY